MLISYLESILYFPASACRQTIFDELVENSTELEITGVISTFDVENSYDTYESIDSVTVADLVSWGVIKFFK